MVWYGTALDFISVPSPFPSFLRIDGDYVIIDTREDVCLVALCCTDDDTGGIHARVDRGFMSRVSYS